MLSNIDFGSYFHTKKYEKGLSTGGDKIADWGGSKGGWGGHVPPVFMLKEALSRIQSILYSSSLQSIHNYLKRKLFQQYLIKKS